MGREEWEEGVGREEGKGSGKRGRGGEWEERKGRGVGREEGRGVGRDEGRGVGRDEGKELTKVFLKSFESIPGRACMSSGNKCFFPSGNLQGE